MRLFAFTLMIFLVSQPLLASVVEEKKFSLEEKAEEKLIIEGHQKGEIDITGSNTEKIIISGYLEVYGDDHVEIRQFYEGVSVEATRKENQVLVQISRPEVIFPGMDHAIFLELLVPGKINLEIKTNSGRITIIGVEGDISVKGSGAFLEVKDSSGNIEAKGLESGRIENFSGGEIILASEEKVKIINVEGEIQEEIISK